MSILRTASARSYSSSSKFVIVYYSIPVFLGSGQCRIISINENPSTILLSLSTSSLSTRLMVYPNYSISSSEALQKSKPNKSMLQPLQKGILNFLLAPSAFSITRIESLETLNRLIICCYFIEVDYYSKKSSSLQIFQKQYMKNIIKNCTATTPHFMITEGVSPGSMTSYA